MPPRNDGEEEVKVGHLVKNLSIIAAIVVPLLSIAVSWGIMTASQSTLNKRLDELEALKLGEAKIQLEYNSRRTDKLEISQERTNTTINDMDKKLSIIAEWVIEQKRKGSN